MQGSTVNSKSPACTLASSERAGTCNANSGTLKVCGLNNLCVLLWLSRGKDKVRGSLPQELSTLVY